MKKWSFAALVVTVMILGNGSLWAPRPPSQYLARTLSAPILHQVQPSRQRVSSFISLGSAGLPRSQSMLVLPTVAAFEPSVTVAAPKGVLRPRSRTPMNVFRTIEGKGLLVDRHYPESEQLLVAPTFKISAQLSEFDPYNPFVTMEFEPLEPVSPRKVHFGRVQVHEVDPEYGEHPVVPPHFAVYQSYPQRVVRRYGEGWRQSSRGESADPAFGVPIPGRPFSRYFEFPGQGVPTSPQVPTPSTMSSPASRSFSAKRGGAPMALPAFK